MRNRLPRDHRAAFLLQRQLGRDQVRRGQRCQLRQRQPADLVPSEDFRLAAGNGSKHSRSFFCSHRVRKISLFTPTAAGSSCRFGYLAIPHHTSAACKRRGAPGFAKTHQIRRNRRLTDFLLLWSSHRHAQATCSGKGRLSHPSVPDHLISWQLSQGQTANGSLRGEVQDANGRRVAAATVSVEARGSGWKREVKADDRGEFRVNDLLPGPYRVVVRAEGFAEASSNVDVVVSFVRDLLVALKPAPVQQTVNVQGQASSITTEPIDTASAVHQGAVSSRDLATIPLAHRSFANIAYLVPGTEPVEPSDPTKARITAVSSGGSSGLNNVLSVDGMDDSDDYIGGFLQNFSPDAIQEFAFRTAQEDADTGRTTAGSVVITTKHGTNEWHGSGAFYERASALDGAVPDRESGARSEAALLAAELRGHAGWSAQERQTVDLFVVRVRARERQHRLQSGQPDGIHRLASLAAQGLIPGVNSIPVPQNAPIPFRDAIGLLRFDWAQTQKSQWFLRGSIDNYTTETTTCSRRPCPRPAQHRVRSMGTW